ncbi:MAG: zinc ribbon domain-containing protein [Uliginosibacterium sp.]|nr:zinc ribbon domain-containing protein [Uliginosibacterium sp.]
MVRPTKRRPPSRTSTPSISNLRLCTPHGIPLSSRIPAGETRPRLVCIQCGETHYIKPKIAASTASIWN